MKVFKTKKEAISFLSINGADKKHIQEVINKGVTKWNEKLIIVDENELL